MPSPSKVAENRVRRAAARQGYVLQKSRRRDARAIDYGLWKILDSQNNVVVEDMTLDQVEAWLVAAPERR